MSTQYIQVLNRSLDIIEQLATSERGLTITELSHRTGLPKSTIHRILATYADRYYIGKDSNTNIYYLGHKFVEIASIYLNKIILKTEAAPIMHRVASIFNAICYLGIMENNEVMYLSRVEPLNSLRLYTQIGKREPLHCTALGKILLAALPKAEFQQVVNSLKLVAYTNKTITNPERLVEEIEQVRIKGYATDDGEHMEGNMCLAVPIYDYTRQTLAALSVSANNLLNIYEQNMIIEVMNTASVELSHLMGYTMP